MTQVQIRKALQTLRAAFDVFEVDPRTGRRRIVKGPSIFDVERKTRTTKGAE
jgi:hypothetical protein